MWLRGLWLRAWRLPLLVVLLVYGLASALLAFPLIGESARRAQIAGWSRWLLRACGVQPIELSPPAEGRLADRGEGQMLLLNHLSWLDIFVIDALAPATFVAKSEIARWPLLGTLVAAVGTEFIERGRRHAVHRVIERLDAKLGAGTRVAVFPEGTTTDGRRLLPFHGNLAQAAINAGAPVVPVGLRYLDPAGQPSDVPLYIGDDHFLGTLWRIIGHPRLIAEVHVLPAIPPAEGLTRQALVRLARESISGRLGLALEDKVPESLRVSRG